VSSFISATFLLMSCFPNGINPVITVRAYFVYMPVIFVLWMQRGWVVHEGMLQNSKNG
jgi:hypothetical protein